VPVESGRINRRSFMDVGWPEIGILNDRVHMYMERFDTDCHISSYTLLSSNIQSKYFPSASNCIVADSGIPEEWNK
jgi:hypothetical protein